MTRICPNCSKATIAVNSLVMSDVACTNCKQRIGVHWLFRVLFFVIILAAAAATGVIVFVDQGLYAALLFISVPIGAIGYIKARFSPLVVRRSAAMPPGTSKTASSGVPQE